MTWSAQQEEALREVRVWLRDGGRQLFRLFGYAGTGKTTLARSLAADVQGKVLFGAFTGKAALVLRRKGCADAQTIHSMIYKVFEKVEVDADGRERIRRSFGLNPLAEARLAKLIIIDECSMVDARLGQDLLSFGKPVLVLGDPAQLPPVRGEGYFTADEPDVLLTEIHRQARDNPIIRLSMDVREGRRLQPGEYGTSRVLGHPRVSRRAVLEADQVLVGLNKSRRTVNAKVRAYRGHDEAGPVVGDKIVCLKNDREKGLLNGGLWIIREIVAQDGRWLDLKVVAEDGGDPIDVAVRREFFEGREEDLTAKERKASDEFTYGYGLTVHKSQGSQWNDVVVFDESGAFRQHRDRHLYTAITRAAERVTVVAA